MGNQQSIANNLNFSERRYMVGDVAHSDGTFTQSPLTINKSVAHSSIQLPRGHCTILDSTAWSTLILNNTDLTIMGSTAHCTFRGAGTMRVLGNADVNTISNNINLLVNGYNNNIIRD